MDKRAKIGSIIGLLFLIACIGIYFAMSRGQKLELKAPPIASATLESDHPTASPLHSEADIQARMAEIQSWKLADQKFSTDAKEPLALVRSDREVVYIKDNQLLYERVGGTNYQNIPLIFPGKRNGYVWRSGQLAYIGFTLESGGEAQKGEWYEINLANGNANPLKRLGEIPLPPDRVAAVSISENPAGAAVLIKNKETYQEYMISSTGKGPLYINDYSSSRSQEITNRWIAANSSTGKNSFDKITRLDLSGMDLFVMEDAEGLLIYQTNSSNPGAYRFSGYKLEQAKRIQTEQPIDVQPGSSSDGNIIMRVKNDAGVRNMVLLPSNNPVIMADEPKLLEEGWSLFSGLSFVKTANGQIETISFPIEQASVPLQSHYAVMSVDSITNLTRKRSVWEGERDGKHLFLSHYDLINNRLKKTNDLWMPILQPGKMIAGKNPAEQNQETAISVPKLAPEDQEKEQAPAVLLTLLQNRDAEGSGDVSLRRTIRKIGNTWYVLTMDRLEQWEGAGLKQIGLLPITNHATTSNYTVVATAQDFTREYGYWYVADTYGNRILKLDDKWKIVTEKFAAAPTRITGKGKGELEVKSLQGTLLYSDKLKLKSTIDTQAESVEKLPAEDVKVPSDSYYEPSKSIRWVLLGEMLYIYDSAKKTIITHDIGAMTNLYGHPRIVPYDNQILILLDDHIHVFNRQGDWQKLISFPRVQPDGIYTSTPKGENSYQLDKENGKLYLIQGYRLLRVDLTTGAVDTLLWQNNSNTGKLLVDRGYLYFTLFTSNGYGAADSSNELVACKISTEICSRSKIPTGYISDHVTKEHLLALWLPTDPSGLSASGTFMTYKLNEKGSPE